MSLSDRILNEVFRIQFQDNVRAAENLAMLIQNPDVWDEDPLAQPDAQVEVEPTAKPEPDNTEKEKSKPSSSTSAAKRSSKTSQRSSG